MDRRKFLTGLAGSTVGAALSGCSVSRWISSSPQADNGRLRRLHIDHEACFGCFRCEEICREVNRPQDEDRPVGRERDRSLIHVLSFMPGPFHVIWACLGCPDVPCVAACDYYADPLGHRKALHVDSESGAISLDRQWCAGCERCIDACQTDGGGVLYWDEEAYIAGACHLCSGSPACIDVCPVGAISLVEVDRSTSLELRSPEAVARDGISRREGRDTEPERLNAGNAPLSALRVDHDRCTGCRLCEAACGERNGPIQVDGQRLPGLGDMTESLIRVHRFPGPYYVAWACLGCPDLPCVAACETECFGPHQRSALGVDPTSGSISLASEFCTGCQKCIDACQAEGGDVLRWDPERFVVGFCHLCGGEPACVPACPFDALEMVTVDRGADLQPRRIEEVARLGIERVYAVDSSESQEDA